MNDLVKIREVSERYNLSARTLRYYEDAELIISTRSDDYAYRLYDKMAIKRLEQILILRKLNVSIKDIRRIFDAPGSEVVLDVLGKKADDIDGEVALLHELKDIILAFIRQIRNADFSDDGDVKLLYDKVKDIEAQVSNVDYDDNPSNVNRLLEVAAKLERTSDIVRKLPHFYLHLHVSDPISAAELYRKVFGADIISSWMLCV